MAQQHSVSQADKPLATDIVNALALGATEAVITGSSDVKLFGVGIDCSNNTGEDVYVPFYATASPNVGTTKPRMLLKGEKGKVTTYLIEDGYSFSANMSFAVVKEAGGMGTTPPSGTVNVRMLATIT